MGDIEGTGTKGDPWVLHTPPGSSEFEAYRDPEASPPALVVQVGATELRYHLRCIDDLHAMLAAQGDWVPLGSAERGASRHSILAAFLKYAAPGPVMRQRTTRGGGSPAIRPRRSSRRRGGLFNRIPPTAVAGTIR